MATVPPFVERRGARACAAALSIAFAAGAQAGDGLPVTLPGQWSAVSQGDAPQVTLSNRFASLSQGGRTLSDGFELRFAAPPADGPVSGRMDWRGIRCGALDEPFRGTWDGAELVIETRLRPGVNAQQQGGDCGEGVFRLTLARKPWRRALEGDGALDGRVIATVTATP